METLTNWILKVPAIRRIVYTRLFKEATDDVLATIIDDSNEKAKAMAEEMLLSLFSPVDPRKIITLDKRHGAIYIGGVKADEAQLINLQAEADFILKTSLWTLIHETPKELAQKAMFVDGENLDTMRKGRTMLYTLQTQKNIVELLAGYMKKETASRK